MNLRQRAKELKNRLAALYLALRRKDTPLVAKIAAGVTIAYALSPIDLIPDFIPVLGYLDDIILLPLMIALCIRLIPKEIMSQCEAQALDMWKTGQPKRWYYALPIIILWLAVLGLILYSILF